MQDDGGLEESVNSLKRALFGNGKPEESVLARLCMLEKKFSRMEKINMFILAGVLGLVGNVVMQVLKHQMDGG
jgi:hypothetical protein